MLKNSILCKVNSDKSKWTLELFKLEVVFEFHEKHILKLIWIIVYIQIIEASQLRIMRFWHIPLT